MVIRKLTRQELEEDKRLGKEYVYVCADSLQFRDEEKETYLTIDEAEQERQEGEHIYVYERRSLGNCMPPPDCLVSDICFYTEQNGLFRNWVVKELFTMPQFRNVFEEYETLIEQAKKKFACGCIVGEYIDE